MFNTPLFDLLNFTELIISTVLVNLILDFISSIELSCILLLIKLEQLLFLLELILLPLKLFPHLDLSVPGSDFLIPIVLE